MKRCLLQHSYVHVAGELLVDVDTYRSRPRLLRTRSSCRSVRTPAIAAAYVGRELAVVRTTSPASERYVQRGYGTALKRRLKDLAAMLEEIEREAWSEIETAPAPRVCEWCRATIDASKRRDAKTCSERCRKLLHRPPKTARGGSRRTSASEASSGRLRRTDRSSASEASAPMLGRDRAPSASPSPATNGAAAAQLEIAAEAPAVACILPLPCGRQRESYEADDREVERSSGTAPTTRPVALDQLGLGDADRTKEAWREVARACLGAPEEGATGPGTRWLNTTPPSSEEVDPSNG